jgi:predicted transcriptional regulator
LKIINIPITKINPKKEALMSDLEGAIYDNIDEDNIRKTQNCH